MLRYFQSWNIFQDIFDVIFIQNGSLAFSFIYTACQAVCYNLKSEKRIQNNRKLNWKSPKNKTDDRRPSQSWKEGWVHWLQGNVNPMILVLLPNGACQSISGTNDCHYSAFTPTFCLRQMQRWLWNGIIMGIIGDQKALL